MTIDDDQAHQRCALEAGATACLHKPLQADSFMAAVSRCLSQMDEDLKPAPYRARRLLDEVGAPLWKELATEFLAQTPQLLAQLETLIGDGSHAQGARIAHKLADSAAMFELAELQASCQALQESAGKPESSAVVEAHRRIVAEAAEAQATIRKQIAAI